VDCVISELYLGSMFCVALMVKVMSWYWSLVPFLYCIARGFRWNHGLSVKDVEELRLLI
jgi:hypothetical protein